MHYHPGALLRNRWTCCQQHGKTCLGCQPTYHLLTRSSSRYAQMRRKDTLTSSHGSHGRRSKSGSVPRGDRSSNPPDGRLDEEGGGSGCGRHGLSNSCFDLTHQQIQNRFDEPVAPDAESRHSSLLSTEPSISMGCITLTRLSLTDSTGPPLSPLPPSADPVGKAEVPGRPLVVWGVEGKSKGSRSQVAPESTTGFHPRRTTFPSSETQPHMTGQKNHFTHSVSVHFSQTATGSPGYHCLTEPRKSRHPKPRPAIPVSQFGASTNLLSPKPVLEPKVSVTDPNTIHF